MKPLVVRSILCSCWTLTAVCLAVGVFLTLAIWNLRIHKNHIQGASSKDFLRSIAIEVNENLLSRLTYQGFVMEVRVTDPTGNTPDLALPPILIGNTLFDPGKLKVSENADGKSWTVAYPPDLNLIVRR